MIEETYGSRRYQEHGDASCSSDSPAGHARTVVTICRAMKSAVEIWSSWPSDSDTLFEIVQFEGKSLRFVKEGSSCAELWLAVH